MWQSNHALKGGNVLGYSNIKLNEHISATPNALTRTANAQLTHIQNGEMYKCLNLFYIPVTLKMIWMYKAIKRLPSCTHTHTHTHAKTWQRLLSTTILIQTIVNSNLVCLSFRKVELKHVHFLFPIAQWNKGLGICHTFSDHTKFELVQVRIYNNNKM